MNDDSKAAVRELLTADTVAVVGCSATPGKAAHEVPAYLQRHGYEILPVNPNRETVLGRPARDTLADVTESIDVVNVFRPSDDVAGIVDAVIERSRTRGDAWGLWLQRGIRDDDAAGRARDAGVTVVQDRCIKVAHRLVDA